MVIISLLLLLISLFHSELVTLFNCFINYFIEPGLLWNRLFSWHSCDNTLKPNTPEDPFPPWHPGASHCIVPAEEEQGSIFCNGLLRGWLTRVGSLYSVTHRNPFRPQVRLGGTRVLGQEAEVSICQWSSERRVTSHLALKFPGPWVPLAHTVLVWGPYLNCLHDLLFGPLVLLTQELLEFLQAPFSPEGPASLWALALLEDQGNVTQWLLPILFHPLY